MPFSDAFRPPRRSPPVGCRPCRPASSALLVKSEHAKAPILSRDFQPHPHLTLWMVQMTW